MTLLPTFYDSLADFEIENYEQSQSQYSNLVWQKLNEINIFEAFSYWLTTLSPLTRLNYQSAIKKIIEHGLINPLMTLQAFAFVNHEMIIDRIKLIDHWSECTRQARAACYISFTGFLSRRLQGVIKKAIPSKEGHTRTFFRVYDKVYTAAMTQVQWLKFLQALEVINARDCLIAKIILQGGKRVNEVLSLQTRQIDWFSREITFIQSKLKGLHKETVITYPETVINQLRKYVGDRKEYVFVTRSGRPVMITQLAITFAKAGQKAGLPFKITPHVLRSSTVTYLKQQGFSDSDIMRVTGHSSSEMIYAYDKASRSDNASQKVCLVH